METLYELCLKRVSILLKRGIWDSCTVTPFLNFPSGIVEDLMIPTDYGRVKISPFFLLLKSGSVTRLDLCRFDLQGEEDLLLELIRENCFKSLRFLECQSKDDLPLIETLIRSCPRLEEFYSNVFPDFECFQNCKKLKILRFQCPLCVNDDGVSPVKFSVLASLPNLEVFSAYPINSYSIANILMHCPRLISLGDRDSLDGLAEVRERTYTDEYSCIGDHLQLKRCRWGQTVEQLDWSMEIKNVLLYKFTFIEKIEIAVSYCPLVEELIAYISHADSCKSLKNLKCLAYLKISFRECVTEYMTNFLELLRVIGPQLKYLSVDSKHPVPVDIVCECCPNLYSLELKKAATVSISVFQPRKSIFMKRLRVMKIDRKALLYLLSSCKELVDLSLCDASCLDDSVLRQILKLNPLSQLKISDIAECSLSRVGFRMFLESARSLERVNFAAFRRDVASVVEQVIDELNLTNVNYGEMFDLPLEDFGDDRPNGRF